MNTTWTDQQRGAFWKKSGKNGKYLAGYVVIDGKKTPVTVFPNNKGSPDDFKKSFKKRKIDKTYFF